MRSESPFHQALVALQGLRRVAACVQRPSASSFMAFGPIFEGLCVYEAVAFKFHGSDSA